MTMDATPPPVYTGNYPNPDLQGFANQQDGISYGSANLDDSSLYENLPNNTDDLSPEYGIEDSPFKVVIARTDADPTTGGSAYLLVPGNSGPSYIKLAALPSGSYGVDSSTSAVTQDGTTLFVLSRDGATSDGGAHVPTYDMPFIVIITPDNIVHVIDFSTRPHSSFGDLFGNPDDNPNQVAVAEVEGVKVESDSDNSKVLVTIAYKLAGDDGTFTEKLEIANGN